MKESSNWWISANPEAEHNTEFQKSKYTYVYGLYLHWIAEKIKQTALHDAPFLPLVFAAATTACAWAAACTIACACAYERKPTNRPVS